MKLARDPATQTQGGGGTQPSAESASAALGPLSQIRRRRRRLLGQTGSGGIQPHTGENAFYLLLSLPLGEPSASCEINIGVFTGGGGKAFFTPLFGVVEKSMADQHNPIWFLLKQSELYEYFFSGAFIFCRRCGIAGCDAQDDASQSVCVSLDEECLFNPYK